MSNGKGSMRRPQSISEAALRKNWERVFGKGKSMLDRESRWYIMNEETKQVGLRMYKTKAAALRAAKRRGKGWDAYLT